MDFHFDLNENGKRDGCEQDRGRKSTTTYDVIVEGASCIVDRLTVDGS